MSLAKVNCTDLSVVLRSGVHKTGIDMHLSALTSIFLCWAVLFAQRLAAEELAANSFDQLKLVVAKAQKVSCHVPVSGALLQELIRANGGSPKFKPQSEAAIKTLIGEYDQIENEFCSPVNGILNAPKMHLRPAKRRSRLSERDSLLLKNQFPDIAGCGLSRWGPVYWERA